MTELATFFCIGLVIAVALAWRFFGSVSTAGFSIEPDGIFLPGPEYTLRWSQITGAALQSGEGDDTRIVLHVKDAHALSLRRCPRWLRTVAETFHPEPSDEIEIVPSAAGLDPKTLLADIKVRIVLTREQVAGNAS